MSRNLDSSARLSNTAGFYRYAPLQLDFENQILITSNTTFVVPPNAKAVKFTAVGGGQAGIGSTSGPGAGYFEKTIYAPFVGFTTSFQLTIGAANGGNTVLADSAGTIIATAFGATPIGAGATLGIGGTAFGGDINSQGSPGGTNPGVGGASGGPFGNSVYNPTYAGRWVYFRESIVNDNVRNYIINTIELTKGSRVTAIGYNTNGTITAEYGALLSPPATTTNGIFTNGRPYGPPSATTGGFGGNGGGNGGAGGYGGNGGPGGTGGPGGYGGNGGPSGNSLTIGGPGGYGGSGGQSGIGTQGPSAPPYGPGGPGGLGGPSVIGGPGGFGGGGGLGGTGGSGGSGAQVPPSGGTPPTGPFIGGPGGPGGTGGPGGPGGFGGGGSRGGNVGSGGAGGFGTPGARPFPSGGPFNASPGPAGPIGVLGSGGQGGPGAVYVEWTMKEPSKLGA